jgi:TPR repeat protein
LRRGGAADDGNAWLRRAAEDGDAEAAMLVAADLDDRDDAPPAEIEPWLRIAAEGGIPLAAFRLASYADHEHDDLDAAERWYRVAIERDAGHYAFNNLAGVLRRLGRFEAAEEEFRRGIAAGDEIARLNLGRMLRDLDRRDEAIELLRTAAEQGVE